MDRLRRDAVRGRRADAAGRAGAGFGWGWRYCAYWDTVYGPGCVETDYRFAYQTDVFAVDDSGGRLLCTGITRSVDPTSTGSVTHEINGVLLPVLTRQGILAARSD